MSYTTAWTVTVQITEEGDLTRAHATVDTGARIVQGVGEAHRNPADFDLPEIGDELATGRALRDLARHLLRAAEVDLDEAEERLARVIASSGP